MSRANRIAAYEAAKSHYTLTNPRATAEQYQAEMQKLAQKYKI